MNTFKPVALVPVYNHDAKLAQVVSALRELDLGVILVDDGSRPETAERIRSLAAEYDATALRLTQNSGKGAAVMKGIEHAAHMGFTHALQVDADGQHDLRDAKTLLELARKNPGKLISGKPVYDHSVPKGRLYGRYATHVWVWIESLSFSLKDSMCGYRVYPVEASLRVAREEHIGKRMDFDTEIMVRLYWRGHDSLFLPTRVVYPPDGVSHFRMWADNWLITRMHVRLFFGMLLRIPRLVHRKFSNSGNWSRIGERGSLAGMRFLVWLHGLLGQRVFDFMLKPVVLYFLATHGLARRASRDYLARVHPLTDASDRFNTRPTLRNVYRHFLEFAHVAFDKLKAWQGQEIGSYENEETAETLQSLLQNGRGALLISAHLGNLEVCRVIARNNPAIKINALVYTRNAAKFTRMLDETNSAFRSRLIVVDDVGPDLAIRLRSLIDQSELVVIVGDRVPATDNGQTVTAEFLGANAEFAIGPYLLGHILECPVGLLFCVKEQSGYRIFAEHFADRIHLQRPRRRQQLQHYARQYAARLEHYTYRYPLQWFNFYDFWQPDTKRCNARSSNRETAHEA